MKKLLKGCICLLLCLSSISITHAKSDELKDDEKYRVVNVLEDGSYEIVQTKESYPEAKVAHTLLQNKYHNLGITYGKKFLTINSGVVAFNKAKDCSVNISYTNVDTNAEGYTNGCYGVDAAFLEYNVADNKVKFRLSGVTAWSDARNVTIYPVETIPNVSNFTIKDQELYHNLKSTITVKTYDNSIMLGKAPSYLKEGTTYYSYDTNYFYTSYATMVNDYKSNNHKGAVNATTPYYNYYQYVSHRSTSNYTNKDVETYLNETLMLKNTITNFKDKDNNIHDILTQSMLVQGKDAFFQYQNEFGANAIMMMSLAMNESANGRSILAYSRNNLFGHAAYDSDVEKNASRYGKVNDSIYSHAKNYMSNAYLNPKQFQFHGGHFGNKVGGMNVQYASDPYWGEKAASYYYAMDKKSGEKDYEQYSLGITNKQKVEIKKEPDAKSTTLYSIDKGDEASFILLDKQVEATTTWYLVQSDASLDNDRNLSKSATYNFKKSYGYIKESDLASIVNKNKLTSKIYKNITFDANGGTFYPKDTKITMPVESNKVPVVLAPEKDHALFIGWDKELVKADIETAYQANYQNVREITLTTKPESEYALGSSLQVTNGKIQVSFSDASHKEVDLTTDMVSGYDAKKEGKQTLTIHYAGCDINYEINVSKKQADSKDALQERAAYIIKNYSDKTNLTDEALMELTSFKEEAGKQKENPLSIDTIRAIDRILQPNLSPRYSVILKDDTYDLQVSGLRLALQESSRFIHNFMPKTIVIKLKDSVDNDIEERFTKVAAANNMRYDSSFSIGGKDDFSGFNPQSEVVYSLKKPKNSENRLYRIYMSDGDDVIQLATTQSKDRILFKAKVGSFALVSFQETDIKDTFDFSEVNTSKGNGKNYINTFILLPSIILLLGGAGTVAFLYKKKKRKPKTSEIIRN